MKILKKFWKKAVKIKFFNSSIDNICNFAFVRGFRGDV